MRKAERLFQVVNLVRSHQPITAQKLADKLGVSIRTVYRYIDDISASNIPLYGEPGLGYRLHDNFELQPLTLTPDEIDALMLGVEMLTHFTGVAFPFAARSLLHKIEAALPAHSKNTLQTRLYALNMNGRSDIPQCWDVLRHSIKVCRIISFTYDTIDGFRSQRQVYPLGLFYWGGKWTLGAWCTLRSAFREFRIDRISGLQVLDCIYQPTEKINLQAYNDYQRAAWADFLAKAPLTQRCQQ
jgi:predicted DNA-binding transcriptional regulator YafY